MPNIRLREAPIQRPPATPPFELFIDFVEGVNGLEDKDDLATAILVALASNALADPSDDLPNPNDNNRQGWWGDLDAKQIWSGWSLGTRAWEMTRDALRLAGYKKGATLAKAILFTNQAIQPFVDAGIISSFIVTGQVISNDTIVVSITIYRSNSPAIALQYQYLWDEIAARGSPDSSAAQITTRNT